LPGCGLAESPSRPLFSAAELRQAKQAAAAQRKTPEGGRTLTVRAPASGVRVGFIDATDNQKIVSVILERPKGKSP